MTTGRAVDKGYKRVQHVGSEGQLMGKCTVRSLSTAGALTYTPSQFLSSVIKRDPNGAARTDTTPTAANILAKFPEAQVGDFFDLTIYNVGDGTAEILTLAAGVGMTFVGDTTIPQGCSLDLRVRFTSIASATAEIYTSAKIIQSAPLLRRNIVTITAASYNPTVEESGTTYILKRATAITVTLPTISGTSGVYYKFIVGLAFASSAHTVVANAANILGPLYLADVSTGTDSANTGAGTAVQTITFAHASEALGDWVEVLSDGVNWFVTGGSFLAAGITLT